MKFTRALIPVAVAALLLAGCSSTGDGDADTDGGTDTPATNASECLTAGASSELFTVTGDHGTELTLETESAIKAGEIERSVLTEGSGNTPAEDQEILATMNIFSGATGELLQFVPEQPVVNTEAGLAEWAYEAFRCSSTGQRVAMVLPADTAYSDPSVVDLTADDAVVVVLDITGMAPGTLDVAELPGKAWGTELDAPEGFPTVELDADGAPTITVGDLTAPTELQVATLIEGDGEVVEEGDRVYVNYRGIIWSTGEEFDSSWSRGTPIDFLTTGVIDGFKKALEGQKVGSQVISVVPAEDGGYGADWLVAQGYEPDDVMVFVLDILGTVHAE